jgi:PIN domain nuclease of toxin-antitoxin system
LRLLVDTQAALWLLSKDKRLPPTARELIFDRSVDCFLSAASVWEVAIKRRLGKLNALADFHIHLRRHGVAGLPVYDRHAVLVADLPFHHHDPFDRLLVAQAIVERMSILSIDPILRKYDVPVLW